MKRPRAERAAEAARRRRSAGRGWSPPRSRRTRSPPPGRRRRSRRRASAAGDLVGAVEVELQVLGGERVGRARARAAGRGVDQGQRQRRRRSPARRRAPRPARRRCRAAPPSGEIATQQAVVAVLGLGAEVEREQSRVGASRRRRRQLARPGDAVDADLAGDEPLGLGHPAVAGPGDHVDRRNGLGAVGEGGDRLRAADRVDLADAGDRAGCERPPCSAGAVPRPGGVATASRPTPATRAGIAAHQDATTG